MPPIINKEKCNCCGECVDLCPQDVFFGSENNSAPVISYRKNAALQRLRFGLSFRSNPIKDTAAGNDLLQIALTNSFILRRQGGLVCQKNGCHRRTHHYLPHEAVKKAIDSKINLANLTIGKIPATIQKTKEIESMLRTMEDGGSISL